VSIILDKGEKMPKKLGYDFLSKGFSPPKAVNGNILVEIIAKTSTRKSATGLIYAVNEQAERSPYFIVRDVSEGAKKTLTVKAGDVVGFVSRDLISWVEASGDRYAVANIKDIGVVWEKVDDSPEEYVDTPDLDLSGRMEE
jgi:co-chaperonin GroES (HSP10)